MSISLIPYKKFYIESTRTPEDINLQFKNIVEWQMDKIHPWFQSLAASFGGFQYRSDYFKTYWSFGLIDLFVEGKLQPNSSNIEIIIRYRYYIYAQHLFAYFFFAGALFMGFHVFAKAPTNEVVPLLLKIFIPIYILQIGVYNYAFSCIREDLNSYLL